jgi:hypothetical protein
LRDVAYYLILASKWLSGITVALLTFLADKNPDSFSSMPFVSGSIQWSRNHTMWAFALAVYFAIANFACKQIGPPWAWKAIKRILDGFQKQVVRSIPGAAIDEHRVTLFKHVRCNLHWRQWRDLKERLGTSDWPGVRALWQVKWFKPIARSGHVGQRNIAWFPFFEDRSPGSGTTGEGVIGAVWRTQGVTRIDNLPAGAATDAAALTDYANRVFVSEGWLKQSPSRVAALSYCGIFIEVKGNPWGVIIVDSRSPQLPVTAEQVELAAIALGEFIEKA